MKPVWIIALSLSLVAVGVLGKPRPDGDDTTDGSPGDGDDTTDSSGSDSGGSSSDEDDTSDKSGGDSGGSSGDGNSGSSCDSDGDSGSSGDSDGDSGSSGDDDGDSGSSGDNDGDSGSSGDDDGDSGSGSGETMEVQLEVDDNPVQSIYIRGIASSNEAFLTYLESMVIGNASVVLEQTASAFAAFVACSALNGSLGDDSHEETVRVINELLLGKNGASEMIHEVIGPDSTEKVDIKQGPGYYEETDEWIEPEATYVETYLEVSSDSDSGSSSSEEPASNSTENLSGSDSWSSEGSASLEVVFFENVTEIYYDYSSEETLEVDVDMTQDKVVLMVHLSSSEEVPVDPTLVAGIVDGLGFVDINFKLVVLSLFDGSCDEIAAKTSFFVTGMTTCGLLPMTMTK